MDVLRKELNAIYEAQHLEWEQLDPTYVKDCQRKAEDLVSINNGCCIVTDASADLCYVYTGTFGRLMGFAEGPKFSREYGSSDEDIIYERMHPEDLVEKRMLEYELFKMVDQQPDAAKLNFVATCRIRIRDGKGQYTYIENSTQVMRLSPLGKIWLILCCYNLSPNQDSTPDIAPCIIDNEQGTVNRLSLGEKRRQILTKREKEILRLIRDGKPSKQIADSLSISINTVNRHRQNILEKLSVGSSIEAVTAATAMKLI